MSNKIRNRVLAILFISFIGCWFIGAPLVNVQAEENTSIDEELGYIKGTLDQMNERLLELNHLGDRIDSLYLTIIGATVVIVITNLATPFIEKRLSE